MKRLVNLLVVLMMVMLIISCTAEQTVETAKGSPFFATYTEASDQAQTNSRDILIDFYTDW